MKEDKLRIKVCEHTNRPVVQQKFGEEWVCIHDETKEEEEENINKYLTFKQQSLTDDTL
jgi:hypothetical protein